MGFAVSGRVWDRGGPWAGHRGTCTDWLGGVGDAVARWSLVCEQRGGAGIWCWGGGPGPQARGVGLKWGWFLRAVLPQGGGVGSSGTARAVLVVIGCAGSGSGRVG